MATYEITTDKGTYQIETQDRGQQQQSVQSSTPTMSLADRAWDNLGRFGKGAYEATNFIPGIKNPLADRIYGGIPKAQGLSQQIPEALGGVAPTVAMAGPFIQAARVAGASPLIASALGFGGFSGAKSAAQGKDLSSTSLDALIGGATGLAYGVGGVVGERIASAVTKPVAALLSPVAVKTIGTALGQAAVGAVTSPEDQRLSGSLVAGGLGALNPSKVVSAKEYDAQINKNADIYRTIAPPVPSDIRKVETGFTEKDINDSYKLMAKEGVPILNDHGTKDTSVAIKQLSDRSSLLEGQLNSYLDSNKSRQFNLNDVRNEAKLRIENSRLPALERESQMKKVDDYINSEISSLSGQGLMLDGSNLNNVKSNMYKVSFNGITPADAPAAKQIASVIKTKIEGAYSGQPIKDINNQIGKYATAKYLLQKSHGTKVHTTKGTEISAIAGGISGLATQTIGVHPLISSALAGAGSFVAPKINEGIQNYYSNPKRITGALKNKLDSLSVR